MHQLMHKSIVLQSLFGSSLLPNSATYTLTHTQQGPNNAGRFVMYSGITKIFDWKTVGHVFT